MAKYFTTIEPSWVITRNPHEVVTEVAIREALALHLELMVELNADEYDLERASQRILEHASPETKYDSMVSLYPQDTNHTIH